MRGKSALLTVLLLLAFALPASAQYVLTGSAPSGVKWNRIRSEHFDIIFPSTIDSLARVYLYSFEKTRAADLIVGLIVAIMTIVYGALFNHYLGM